MINKHSKGFTFIEVLMVIAIIGILSGAGAWIMAYTVKNSVFIPNQLNMDKLANDALNIMIEGDSQAKGLRFARVISAIADNRVDFINQDNLTIYYRLNTGTSKLYRSISGAAEVALPYYSGVSGIALTGGSSKLFTYYDSSDAVMLVSAAAANVRRIRMILIAKTGTGLYNDWEGSSEQASAVTLKRLQ